MEEVLSLRDKIQAFERLKKLKLEQMNVIYHQFKEKEEFIDMLMLQLGKEIEESFPGVKFRLLSRFKTPESFENKVNQDLTNAKKTKDIEDIIIYDIVALSIIIEEIPDNIKTVDEKFNTYIQRLIDEKNKYENSKEENMEMLKYVEKDVQDSNGKLVPYIEKKIEESNQGILISKNNCNHAFADFIVKNIDKFHSINILELRSIPKRYKQKENFDGYRAVHNCIGTKTSGKMKWYCEIQGKSLDSYIVAEKGTAAKYHNQVQEVPGKALKSKKIPDFLDKIKVQIESGEDFDQIMGEISEEDKQKFLEICERKVPEYRLYVSPNYSEKQIQQFEREGKDIPQKHIYKLSKKEAFILFYSNQLVGNETLNIPPQPEIFKSVVDLDLLPDDDDEEYTL